MEATLVDIEGKISSLRLEEFPAALPVAGFYWLDVDGASPTELERIASALRLDEGSRGWLLRSTEPTAQRIAHGVRFVTLALADAGGPVDVHLLWARDRLLTFHGGASRSMRRARTLFREVVKATIARMPGFALVTLLEELLVTFDPHFDRFDERLEALEDAIFFDPSEVQLLEVASLRKQIASLRKTWARHLSVLNEISFVAGRAGSDVSEAPIADFRNYVGRVEEVLGRLDELRGRTTDAMQSYGATVANRQSELINRLTIISGLFLPLTVVTGFFGMNFGYLGDVIGTRRDFLLLGLGLNVLVFLSMVILLTTLARRTGRRARRRREAAQRAASNVFDPSAEAPR
jgi:magnesium transporter